MERDITLFYKSKDIVAHYEKVDGVYLAHIEVNKWSKDICTLVINLLLDFCENINEKIYAPVLDKKHEKFLKAVAFLPTDGSILLDGEEKQLYEWRVL